MDILQAFTQYILQIGYSKASQYQIPNCIKEFLQQVDGVNIKKISQQDILNFYEYLQSRPLKRRIGALSEAMINHYVFSLKTFFSWLEQTEQIKYNPISNIKFKRPKSNPRKPLSQDEIQTLFNTTKTSKEKALLHLFYSCGLRRTEAENLNVTDIHFTQNILYVREGKGAKRRAIPITEKVKKELENYLNNEKLLMVNCKCKEAFMHNQKGNRMSGNSCNVLFKEIVKRSGVGKEVTLHHLRHSIATHLFENGLSIEFVRDFLGHSHLESTQIYAKVFKYQLKNL
jgi:integrase/recombinase XerD